MDGLVIEHPSLKPALFGAPAFVISGCRGSAAMAALLI